MSDKVNRERLKKIVNAFLNDDKGIAELCKNSSEKDFLIFLKSLKRKDYKEPRFELQGYPIYRPTVPPIRSEIHKNMLVEAFLSKGNKIKQRAMMVAISYRCSYDCDQCYVTEYRDPLRKEMTVDEFKIIFNKAVNEIGVWHFDITGGEPFEHPYFFEIIKQIPQDRATAIVATNGLLIDGKMVSRIKNSNIMICKVSLDIYSGLNSGSVKKVLSTIKMLTDSRIYTFAQVYLKKGFAGHFDLRAVIEECRKAGAAAVNLISPMAIGNLKNHDELFLTDEDRKDIYFWRKYYSLIYGYKVMLFPDWEFTNDGCLAARGRIYINPYGDIYPCCFIPKAYGNILTDDLGRVISKMQDEINSLRHCYSTNSSSNTQDSFERSL
jgi:MoaA/NifB/PqqE/SkfB family radical SAM enzyme